MPKGATVLGVPVPEPVGGGGARTSSALHGGQLCLLSCRFAGLCLSKRQEREGFPFENKKICKVHVCVKQSIFILFEQT